MARVEEAPGFFHYSAKHVRAREHRRAHRIVVGYMRQLHERNLRTRTRVSDPLTYMLRQRQLEDAQRDVLYHRFFDNGSGLTSDELWMANDRANRCKDGRYKEHAGHMPRLGSFITASFPYGVSLSDAIAAVDRHAEHLGSTYGVACEAVIHAKNNQPDHAHFFITDRLVDANGVGRKQRKMNGMAAKLGGDGIEVADGYIISGPMEDMRASWAALMRELAPLNVIIDHRSFARRGLDIEPVTYVPREEVREQEARGEDGWKRRRKRELAERALRRASEAEQAAGGRTVEAAPTTRFPDLATKRRHRRSRRPRDADVAAMAYAARRRVENEREDNTSAAPTLERPAGDRLEPLLSPRFPDLAVRSGRRRSLRKMDADIACMAYAARREIERPQHENRTSVGVHEEQTPQDGVISMRPSSNALPPGIPLTAPEGTVRGAATTTPATTIVPEHATWGPSGDKPLPEASPQLAAAAGPWSSLAIPTPMRRPKSSSEKSVALAMMAYVARLESDALHVASVGDGRTYGSAATVSSATLTRPPPAISPSGPAERHEDARRPRKAAEPPRRVLAALALIVGGLRQATAAALLTYVSRHLPPAGAPTSSKPPQKSSPDLLKALPKGRSRRARAKDAILELALGLAAKRSTARNDPAMGQPEPSETLSKAFDDQELSKPASARNVGVVPRPDESIATAAPPPVPVRPEPTHEVTHRRTSVRDIVLDSAFRVLEEGHIEPVITVRAAMASPAETASRPGPAIQNDDRRPFMTPAQRQVERELAPPSVGHHAQDRTRVRNDALNTPDCVQAASSRPDAPENHAFYAGQPAGTVAALQANGTTLQAGLVADTAARNDPSRSIPIGTLERPGVPKQRMLQKEHEEGLVDHRPEPMTAPTAPSAAQSPDGRPSVALTDIIGSTSPTTARRPNGGDTISDTTDDHDDRKKLTLRALSGLAIDRRPQARGADAPSTRERDPVRRADRPLGSAPDSAARVAAGRSPGHDPATQGGEMLAERHEEGLLDRRPLRAVTPKVAAGKATIGGRSEHDRAKPIGQAPTDMAIVAGPKHDRPDATTAKQERSTRSAATIAGLPPRAPASRNERTETTSSPPHEQSSTSQGAATATRSIDEGRADRAPGPTSAASKNVTGVATPQKAQSRSVDDLQSLKNTASDYNQPTKKTERVPRHANDHDSRAAPRGAPPAATDAGRPRADEHRELLLRYAAALRRDRQLSRSILTLMVAHDPRIDMDQVERALANLQPQAKSREIKDEVRAIATRSGDTRLLAQLDAVDELVRQARRDAQTRRPSPVMKRRGGLDPTD